MELHDVCPAVQAAAGCRLVATGTLSPLLCRKEAAGDVFLGLKTQASMGKACANKKMQNLHQLYHSALSEGLRKDFPSAKKPRLPRCRGRGFKQAGPPKYGPPVCFCMHQSCRANTRQDVTLPLYPISSGISCASLTEALPHEKPAQQSEQLLLLKKQLISTLKS